MSRDPKFDVAEQTPAETLRKAAALMRSRAAAATFTAEPWAVDEIGAVWAQEADGNPVPVASRSTDADATHIASWHPTVALDVADLLETWSYWTGNPDDLDLIEITMNAVARAYLGGDR